MYRCKKKCFDDDSMLCQYWGIRVPQREWEKQNGTMITRVAPSISGTRKTIQKEAWSISEFTAIHYKSSSRYRWNTIISPFLWSTKLNSLVRKSLQAWQLYVTFSRISFIVWTFSVVHWPKGQWADWTFPVLNNGTVRCLELPCIDQWNSEVFGASLYWLMGQWTVRTFPVLTNGTVGCLELSSIDQWGSTCISCIDQWNSMLF